MSDRRKISERLGKIGTCADIVSGDDTAVSEVPLSDLHEFKGHPFRVTDDEQMAELVESIKKNGVLTAGTVRLRAEGGYALSEGKSHGIIRHDKEELPCSLCADLYLQG